MGKYKSSFHEWYNRASVRAKPRRVCEGIEPGTHFFPLECAPITCHPIVRNLGPAIAEEALAQYLFSYLRFTDGLEHEVVNQTTRRIATRASGFDIPSEMRLDAYKIYCDEAYHSLFSADLMFQINNLTGFEYCTTGLHPALEYFHSKVEGVELEHRAWFELFFVIVSETLISGTLAKIPQSPNVLPAVRNLVADHAEDEGRHHAFFAQICELAWAQLPEPLRHRIGIALPEFILKFLSPDYPSIRAFLVKYLSVAQTEQVIEECYPSSSLPSAAQLAAKATLAVLERSGILARFDIADAFEAKGFSIRCSNLEVNCDDPNSECQLSSRRVSLVEG